jgi:excisionase family DNA binding protein
MTEPILPLLGLDPADVARMPAESLPRLLATLAAHQGAVAAVQAAVAARLAATSPAASSVPAPPEQRWITVRQAAVRVGKDDRYVYRKIHAAKDPWRFTKDGKTVLIDAAALDERLERYRSRKWD